MSVPASTFRPLMKPFFDVVTTLLPAASMTSSFIVSSVSFADTASMSASTPSSLAAVKVCTSEPPFLAVRVSIISA